MPVRPGVPEGALSQVLEAAASQIAVRLHRARLDAGMSQTDVAAAFNRSATWVSKLESGEITPRADLLFALATVLGADAGWLFAGEASGASVFLARMRILDARLDERSRQMVLAAAQAAARPELRAAEERADYSADAAAIEDARRESERLSDAEDDGQDDGEQRQRRRGGR